MSTIALVIALVALALWNRHISHELLSQAAEFKNVNVDLVKLTEKVHEIRDRDEERDRDTTARLEKAEMLVAEAILLHERTPGVRTLVDA